MQISRTVSRIADVLPRAKLALSLYQTARINRAVALLYVQIICFIQDAVKWYNMDKTKSSIPSLTRPYSLGFNDIVEEIAEASRNADKEAAAAWRAEDRWLQWQILHFSEISKSRLLFQFHDSLVAHLVIVNFDRQLSMSTNISTYLVGQAQWIQSSQMAQIRSLKTITNIPSFIRSLQFLYFLRNRRKAPVLMDNNEIAKLQWWHNSQDAPSILIAQAHERRASSIDFAVDYIDLLRANNIPVVWIISHTDVFDEKVCSLRDILLALVMQILELNPGVLAEGSFPVTIQHFQDIESQEYDAQGPSFDLLARCLAGIDHLYVVIDTTLINAIVNDPGTRVDEFLTRLQRILSSKPGVKIVLTAQRSVRGPNNKHNTESIYQINISGKLVGLKRQRVKRSRRVLAVGETALPQQSSPKESIVGQLYDSSQIVSSPRYFNLKSQGSLITNQSKGSSPSSAMDLNMATAPFPAVSGSIMTEEEIEAKTAKTESGWSSQESDSEREESDHLSRSSSYRSSVGENETLNGIMISSLSPLRQGIVDRIMEHFWLKFQEWASSNYKNASGTTTSACTEFPNDNMPGTSSTQLTNKRNGDDEPAEGGGDNNRVPKRPRNNTKARQERNKALDFACPFRKYNPRK
jgi:hypothetical protein